MKRPLQLPLAIALALGAANALALGLGPVHVNSRLNQPLDAEIPVIQATAGEAEGLLVSLAGAEDFERLGLNRSRLNVPIEFAVTKNARGEPVIKVTSKEPVRDTFLDFLVEANWPKGRLLREYTVLLDPPVTAPGTSRSSAASAAPASPGTVTLTRRQPRPERAAAAPAAASAAAKPSAPAEQAARKAADGEYGPVEAGETLSAIARSENVGGVTHNQMMLALLKHNPNAFYKNNINALKRGAILRIPSAVEAKAIGSAGEAAAQAQAQIEDWRGGRASPTLVADAGSAPVATATPAKAKPRAAAAENASPGERLELVPPKAGKDSLAMADRPGAGGGSPALTELKSELSRTKEALTARDQETGELKSRVRELEDLKGKNDRLISLKDSEIAELQRKLKEMQDANGKDSTAKPAATTTAVPPSSAGAPATADKNAPSDDKGAPDKEEIWGNAAASAKPAGDAPKPAEPAAAAEAPATPAAAASAPATAAAPETAPTAAATASEPSAASTAPTAAATTPLVDPAAPKAAAPAAAPKIEKPKPRPARAASPWYEESWVMPAALGGGALLLLLLLFGLRRRSKPAAAAATGRGSIADAFGDSPLSGAAAATADAAYDTGEAGLREQLARDPANVGLHLELLSIYYAERATDKFESAAAEMYAHVFDPNQPEWQEAQAMGREIAPHNPLFALAGHEEAHGFAAAAYAAPVEQPASSVDEFAAGVESLDPPAHTAQATPADDGLGFGLDDVGFEPRSAPATAASATKLDEGFDFDLPPLDFETPAAPAAAEAPAARADDDYFHGEDAVGTKLDLAKAYMDMGDPEGARSMLDEVIAEGSEAQKAEANRLLAEIR